MGALDRVRRLADVVQRADVGMGERGDGAGFAVESLVELLIGGERGRTYLDRDGAVQPRVARL